jgi:Tol biopolymer transport system component
VSLTNPHVAISADGQHVAYRNAAGLGIVVRDLDRFEPRIIAGTGDATQLAGCFSSDGSWLAFTAGVSGQSLKKVSLSGGGSVTVAQNLFQADICDWGSDGFIYFGADPGIMRVAEGGGTAELVAGRRGADGRATVENPKLLPGGKLLYTWYGNASLDTGSVDVMDLATRQTKTVLDAAGIASFLPWARDRARGYVLYGNQETLFAVPFDSRTLETGPIRPVVSDVYGIASLSSATVSASGTLAYLSAPGQRGPVGDAILIEMDRAGTERVLAEKPQLYGEITFAPDGRRASTAMVDASNATLADVWIYELDGDRFVRATFGGANVGVSWTADSQRLVYMHSGSLANIGTEIQTVAADGSGAPSTLIGNSSWMRGLVVPTSLGADGKVLLVANDVGANTDILAVDLDGTLGPLEPNRKPRDFLVTPFSETSAVLSPNGRYVAYTSNESGRNEIYVVPFPGPGAKSPVSRGGGNSPRWNRNGRELFYLNGDELVSVEVDTTGNFRALAPRALFKIPPLLAIRGTPYDVSPDGAHFLMLKAVTSGDAQQSVELRIVVNWIDELERAAPGRR